jgi:glycosyltransferase involved in cell wall biosynthesis
LRLPDVEGPLSVLYVGTLPPHRGGSAHVSARVLAGLAGLGYEIEAIAPITEAELRGGDRFGEQNSWLHLTRYVVPHFYTSPDRPAEPEYHELERRQVLEHVERSLARRLPDVLIAGRESFAPYLAGVLDLPSIVLIQGSTTAGILNGTYPKHQAETMVRSLAQFDLLVTCARHMGESVVLLGFTDVEVIPNPVDLERYRPGPPSPAMRRMLRIGEDDIVVTHPSNLKALKRPLDIVDAAEIALRTDGRLLFVIAGDGPYLEAMQDAAAERRLTHRFRFPGWMDQDLVPGLMRCSDMVVMPSAAEAQALAYLESQATARPLIASDIPAANEVIEDGVTGLLFPVGDAAALAARIVLCARDPKLRARLGRQALDRVAQHALPRVAAAYDAVLRTVSAGSVARDHGTSPSSA